MEQGVPGQGVDTEAKRLLNEDDALRRQIIQHFGSECYSQGSLNRSYQAWCSIMPTLEKLNDIVHPAVGRDSERWFAQQKRSKLTIKEARTIFETEQHGKFDRVILVNAPKEVRILRVMQRDNVSKEAVEARMAHQLSDEEKMAQSHMILNNDGHQDMKHWVQKNASVFLSKWWLDEQNNRHSRRSQLGRMLFNKQRITPLI